MQRKDIVPKGMEVIRERFHYSPGVVVGDTLYIAGQVGRDADLNVLEGAEAQYVQAFENVKKVLNAATVNNSSRQSCSGGTPVRIRLDR